MKAKYLKTLKVFLIVLIVSFVLWIGTWFATLAVVPLPYNEMTPNFLNSLLIRLSALANAFTIIFKPEVIVPNTIQGYIAFGLVAIGVGLIIAGSIVAGKYKKGKFATYIIAIILASFPLVEIAASLNFVIKYNGANCDVGYWTGLQLFLKNFTGKNIIFGVLFIVVAVFAVLSYVFMVIVYAKGLRYIKKFPKGFEEKETTLGENADFAASEPLNGAEPELVPQGLSLMQEEPPIETKKDIILDAVKSVKEAEPNKDGTVKEPLTSDENPAPKTEHKIDEAIGQVGLAAMLKEVVRDIVRDEISRDNANKVPDEKPVPQGSNNGNHTVTGATFGGPLVVQYFNGGINSPTPAPSFGPHPHHHDGHSSDHPFTGHHHEECCYGPHHGECHDHRHPHFDEYGRPLPPFHDECSHHHHMHSDYVPHHHHHEEDLCCHHPHHEGADNTSFHPINKDLKDDAENHMGECLKENHPHHVLNDNVCPFHEKAPIGEEKVIKEHLNPEIHEHHLDDKGIKVVPEVTPYVTVTKDHVETLKETPHASILKHEDYVKPVLDEKNPTPIKVAVAHEVVSEHIHEEKPTPRVINKEKEIPQTVSDTLNERKEEISEVIKEKVIEKKTNGFIPPHEELFLNQRELHDDLPPISKIQTEVRVNNPHIEINPEVKETLRENIPDICKMHIEAGVINPHNTVTPTVKETLREEMPEICKMHIEAGVVNPHNTVTPSIKETVKEEIPDICKAHIEKETINVNNISVTDVIKSLVKEEVSQIKEEQVKKDIPQTNKVEIHFVKGMHGRPHLVRGGDHKHHFVGAYPHMNNAHPYPPYPPYPPFYGPYPQMFDPNHPYGYPPMNKPEEKKEEKVEVKPSVPTNESVTPAPTPVVETKPEVTPIPVVVVNAVNVPEKEKENENKVEPQPQSSTGKPLYGAAAKSAMQKANSTTTTNETKKKESEEPKTSIERIPFPTRLLDSDKELQSMYSEIKNDILSWGVKSRVSNAGDTFRLHTKTYVKIVVAGKSLKLYFALDPKDYADSTIPVQDAGGKGLYEDIPCVFKVKSDLSLKRCKQLVQDCMEKDGLEQGEIPTTDWIKELKAEEKAKNKK